MDQLILVTEQDEIIGQDEKMIVHQNGLCHRAFSVFIFRDIQGQKELLLQQRHHAKYHCGSLWTNTCCGHPHPGEEIVAAGERRLNEEMGLAIKLSHVGRFHYVAHFDNGLTENEVDHVLVGTYQNEKILPNKMEVENYRWMSVNVLENELAQHGKNYTPWFTQALNIALKKERK